MFYGVLYIAVYCIHMYMYICMQLYDTYDHILHTTTLYTLHINSDSRVNNLTVTNVLIINFPHQLWSPPGWYHPPPPFFYFILYIRISPTHSSTVQLYDLRVDKGVSFVDAVPHPLGYVDDVVIIEYDDVVCT